MQKGEIRYFKYRSKEGHCLLLRRCHQKGYEKTLGKKLWWVYFNKGSGEGVLDEQHFLDLVPEKEIDKTLLKKKNKINKLEIYKKALTEIAYMEDEGRGDYWMIQDMQEIAKKALKIS